VDGVFSTTGYWDVDDSPESAWLREGVLPKVWVFLHEQSEDQVRYVEGEWIYDKEESGESWLEVQAWHKNAEPGAAPNGGPSRKSATRESPRDR
jgi:hypothetical protein